VCDRFEREVFPGLRASTRRVYRKMMATVCERLGTITLGGLHPLALEAYRRARTAPVPGRQANARMAVNRELALLAAIYRRCQAWKLICRTDDPFREIRPYAEPRSRERILSFEDQDRLLSALREAARPVVWLGIECGARTVRSCP
jgi:hypothetical protein